MSKFALTFLMGVLSGLVSYSGLGIENVIIFALLITAIIWFAEGLND